VLCDVPTRSATTRRSGAGPCPSSKASNTLARVIIRAGCRPDETTLVNFARSPALKETVNSFGRGGPAPDRRVVAERVGTSQSTVYLVAKAFTTHAGRVEDVITRKKRATPSVEPKR
jgi:hypothetical protein